MLSSSIIFQKKTKNIKPKIAVILGSGLTKFFDNKQILHTILYEELPNFPKPTVKGHSGKLLVGKIDTQNVVCLYGRSHIYEGHDPAELSNPVRFLKDIGCELLIITNAAGSLKENMPPGSLMLIKDHINWSGFNPLIGPNNESYGSRFSDMSDAYNIYYRDQLKNVANKNSQKLFEGVYCMYSGPSFETPAEIKALQIIGGDAVGMSTVPETIVANHCGLSVVGISIMTNYAAGMSKTKLSHQETLEQASLVEEKVLALIKNFICVVKFNDTTGNH